MSESPDPPSQGLSALKLSLAATLVLLLVGWLGVQAYQDRRWVEARLATLARMEFASEEIVRLDHAFTHAARLAVTGGTLDPEAPSRQFEPRLDQYIQEALRLEPRAPDGVAAAMTASAALAAMEDHAFDLLRQGEEAGAQRLLSGGEYAAQKEMYAKGMAAFNRSLRQDRDRARVEARAVMRRIAAQSILTSMLLLLGVWWAVLVERRWHAAIKRNNRHLNQKSAELEDLNNQLDRRVNERTKEVNESALASLNMMQDAVAARSALETVNRGLEGKVSERTAALKAALRSKDMFMANMSHELRTPLNAILGFTGTLLMKLPGAINSEQEEQLNIVKASARHLLSLINDLLDLSKIESGGMQMQAERVNCRKVLEDIAVSLRPHAATKGLSLALLAPDREIHVSTDARALKQIVLNLCNNAIKFTDAGSVTIELKAPVGNQPVEIGVTDTGIGIKPGDRNKLFQVFSQMDSTRRDGAGLGLHLSRKLAHLIHGEVHFTSDYGHGSRFWLTLPQE